MNRRTLPLLFLAVLVLGAAAWRELARERAQAAEAEVALFEDVDPGRVAWVRVENLERDAHMRFEREASGRWTMTDPMRIPADGALVQRLLDLSLERRGTPVPAAEADAKALGLSPPRVVIEVAETRGTEPRVQRLEPRVQRLEIGALDLDGQRVNVRARGRLMRTWRDIDTLLDRKLEEFQTHDALDVSPRDVLEIHRTGSLVRDPAQPAEDISFDALLDAGAWRVTRPVSAPLDPQALSLWLAGFTSLRIQHYLDHGRRLPADMGLDPPEMTVTLGLLGDRTSTLRFGRPGPPPPVGQARGGEWSCTREGQTSTWTVDARAAELVACPLADLLDHRVERFARDAVDGLILARGGRELRLWRETDARGLKSWRVAERATEKDAYGPRLLADEGRVEDLLGRIEKAEIVGFAIGRTVAPADIRGSIVVQAGDLQEGGDFGALEAGPAVRFQRRGDDVAGEVDPALFELMATPATELWTLKLADVPELEQKELVLAGGSVERRFERGSKGLWTRAGSEVEARELRDVLDPLCFVRARAHLGLGPFAPLREPIVVRFTDHSGRSIGFTVGLSPESSASEALIELDGRRSVLKDPDLHRRLKVVLGL